MAIRHNQDVVLNRLEEEPSGVTGIESGVVSLIVQIRDQSVSFDHRKLDDCIFRLLESAVGKEEALQGDECVSAPAAHVASAEVRKSRTHRVFIARKSSGRNTTVHLHTRGSQASRKWICHGMSSKDLVHCSIVNLLYQNAEVLRLQ